jgi:hypothetical protein
LIALVLRLLETRTGADDGSRVCAASHGAVVANDDRVRMTET